jgi:hypothetical protein
MTMLDLVGLRFGKLVPCKLDWKNNKRGYICSCDCGEFRFVTTSDLNSGNAKSCGCLRQSEAVDKMIGKKYGLLTVKSFAGLGSHRRYKYNCTCDCGKERVVLAAYLQSKKVDHCGCLANERKLSRHRLKLGESVQKAVLNNYKRGAKTRNLEFTLTDEEVLNYFKGTCYYCGCLPESTFERKGAYGSFTYNGIDRVDNSKGYHAFNCVTCCKSCNYFKSSFSKEFFLGRVVAIATHLNLVNSDNAKTMEFLRAQNTC